MGVISANHPDFYKPRAQATLSTVVKGSSSNFNKMISNIKTAISPKSKPVERLVAQEKTKLNIAPYLIGGAVGAVAGVGGTLLAQAVGKKVSEGRKKYRSMNPMNFRALKRADSRLEKFVKYARKFVKTSKEVKVKRKR